ncbi:MAG TPA: hypothetical protein VHC98_01835 [Candidatus Saccharimonadales bacterium]|nr:hypothetical protein [Candidatus Saccharimonadales bacterium]
MDRVSTVRKQTLGLLVGYGLQFLAGMLLNLFVTVAAVHPGTQAGEFFGGAARALGWALSGQGGWELAVHAYLAIALVLGTLSLCYSSVLMRSRRWIICSIIAAFFTMGALFNGLSFINYNHDVNSMVMASCWLISVGAIVVARSSSPARR